MLLSLLSWLRSRLVSGCISAAACVLGGLAADAQDLYVSNTTTKFPVQSSTGWYKLEWIQAPQGASPAALVESYLPTTGRRPTFYASVGHAATISGGVLVSTLHFMPIGGTSTLPNVTALYTGGSAAYATINGDFPSGVYPTTDSGVDTKWRLTLSGTTNLYEWKARRTDTSMTYIMLAGSPLTPVAGSGLLVLTASADPFATGGGSGDSEWTRADINNVVGYLNTLNEEIDSFQSRLMYRADGHVEGFTSLPMISTDIKNVQTAIENLNLGDFDDILNSILGEMISDPSYSPSKDRVKGTRTVDFKDLPRDQIKPALEDATGNVGEFGDPYSGDTVTIPNSSSIKPPTVSESGLSYTVNMNLLGGTYGTYPGGTNLLPSNLVLACDFGPVRPFIDICRWLMVGLVTLLSADRVLGELRRM